MLSIRALIVREISRQYMKRTRLDADVALVRHGFNTRMQLLPPARGVTIREEWIDGIRCEWHVPRGHNDAPVLYYLHGGAYLMGNPATHRRLVSFIARAAGMRALLPDYRLAPENPFPAALEDSLRVWRALVRGGMSARDVAVGGDSAGGNLAVATLLSLRDAGEKLPAACVLLSPWLDLAGEGPSRRTRAGRDPWFKPEYMPVVASRYCGEADLRNPLVSPVYADAHGLPVTYIQVGDCEILLSDSTRMADNIAAAGGRAELHVWPDMWHVFQYFIGQMPESRRAIEDIGRFLRAKFAIGRDERQRQVAA